MDFEENFFDCTVSVHTIYHIDKDIQESAVRKLLAVTKRRAPVIIVYSNPDTLIGRMAWLKHDLKCLLNSRGKMGRIEDKFRDIADMQILPWRSLASHHQKKLIPDNRLGRKILAALIPLEDRFPEFSQESCNTL